MARRVRKSELKRSTTLQRQKTGAQAPPVVEVPVAESPEVTEAPLEELVGRTSTGSVEALNNEVLNGSPLNLPLEPRSPRG
jgi:hypothetical protein